MLSGNLIEKRRAAVEFNKAHRGALTDVLCSLKSSSIDSMSVGRLYLDKDHNLLGVTTLLSDQEAYEYFAERYIVLSPKYVEASQNTPNNHSSFMFHNYESQDSHMSMGREVFGRKAGITLHHRQGNIIDYFTLYSTSEYSPLTLNGICENTLSRIRSIKHSFFNSDTYRSLTLSLDDSYQFEGTINLSERAKPQEKFIPLGGGSLLTDRELECLGLLAKGKSVKEIGCLVGLSPTTVITHLNKLKRKSGAPYKSDLINFYYENYLK